MNKWLARGLLGLVVLVFLYGFWVLGWGSRPKVPPGAYRWSFGTPAPRPRTEVVATLLQEKILVAGGFDQFGRPTTAVDLYDPAADSWTSLPDLPAPVHHAIAATIDGIPYVIGGFSGITFAPIEQAHRYIGRWAEVIPLPSPIGAGAAAVLGNRIHIIGGQGVDGNSAAHYVYDPSKNVWDRKADLPQPRDHLVAAALNEQLYAIGGRENGNFSKNFSRVDVYDPVNDTWSTGPDLTKARSGIGAAVLDANIYVFGGEEPAGTIAPVEVYDPLKNTWMTVTSLPSPRHGLGVVALGNTIYTLLGGKRPALSVSAIVEKMEGP